MARTGRSTENFLGAIAQGVNDALLRNRALKEEQRQYDLGRQRWQAEEAERRRLQMQYGEEDYGIKRGREQQEYDLGINRDEGEYGIKRSRALKEHKENEALKDAERQRLTEMGAAIGAEIGDPRYTLENIAKQYGLASIPDAEMKDLERQLKRSQIAHYNNRALNTPGSRAGTSAGGKKGYQSAVQITGMIEKLEQMRKTGVNPVTGEEIKLDAKSKLWLDQTISNLRRRLNEEMRFEPQRGASPGGLVEWAKQTALQILGNQAPQAGTTAPRRAPVPADAFNPILPAVAQSLNPYLPAQRDPVPFTPDDVSILQRWLDSGK